MEACKSHLPSPLPRIDGQVFDVNMYVVFRRHDIRYLEGLTPATPFST
jgi:hypothetical protein